MNVDLHQHIAMLEATIERKSAELDALRSAPRMDTELVSPHILTMFHVSDDENIVLDVDVRPESNDMTIDNGDFTLTLSFDELEAWVGCLTRARDLLVYHKKGKS